MKLVFKTIFFIVTVAFALLLLLAVLSPKISPDLFYPMAFFGVLFPIILFANIIIVIIWASMGSLRFLMPLSVIILGWSKVTAFFGFGGTSFEDSMQIEALKTATINARFFGLYEKKDYADSFIQLVKNENIDILCVQEFFTKGAKQESTLFKIKKATGLHYAYFKTINIGYDEGEVGMLVLCRWPIEEKGEIEFEPNKGNMAIWADLTVNQRKLRIYSVHLQSYRFSDEEYNLLQNIPDSKDQAIVSSKNLISRMKNGFEKRAGQTRKLLEHIENSDRKPIVVGDFNDPPISYTYDKMSSVLTDAFKESGSLVSATYKGPIPMQRIDYIFFDKGFECIGYSTDNRYQSDHKMVKAVIEL